MKLIIVCSLLTVSCISSVKDYDTIQSFPEAKDIVVPDTTYSYEFIANPFTLSKVGNSIVIVDPANRHSYLHLFDSTFNWVESFLNRGRGNNEWAFPPLLSKQTERDSSIYIIDNNKSILSLYNINRYRIQKSFKVPNELGRIEFMINYKDSLIFGAPGNGQGLIFKYDIKKDKIKYIDILAIHNELAINDKINIFGYNNRIGLLNDHVVSIPMYTNGFFIYNIINEDIKHIKIPNINGKNIIYYLDYYLSGDRIYLLYIGEEERIIHDDLESIISEIHIYDLSGKFLKGYKLSIPLVSFIVYNNNIIGTNYYSKDNYSIIKYIVNNQKYINKHKKY